MSFYLFIVCDVGLMWMNISDLEIFLVLLCLKEMSI